MQSTGIHIFRGSVHDSQIRNSQNLLYLTKMMMSSTITNTKTGVFHSITRRDPVTHQTYFFNVLFLHLLEIKPLALAERADGRNALHRGRQVAQVRRSGHVVHELQLLDHRGKHGGQHQKHGHKGRNRQEIPREDNRDESKGRQHEEDVLEKHLAVVE